MYGLAIKIIIFIVILLFLFRAKITDEDKVFWRNLIIGYLAIVVYIVLEVLFFNFFTIPRAFLLLGLIVAIANWKDWKKMYRYALPIILLSIFSFCIIILITIT